MSHALIEIGKGKVRVNTLTIEAAIAALAQVVLSGAFVPGEALANWISRWQSDVGLYGLAHYNLGLDELLEDNEVRQEFLCLIDAATAWAGANGETIPAHLIYSMVGGKHWLDAQVEGRPVEYVVRLLRDIREMVARA